MVYPDYHKELSPELLEMGQSSWTQLVYTYGINNPKPQHSKVMDLADVVVIIQQMKTLCPGPKSADMITRYPHLIPYADKVVGSVYYYYKDALKIWSQKSCCKGWQSVHKGICLLHG